MAGGDVVPNPVVCKESDGLPEKYPRVFPACSVNMLSKKVAGSKSSVEEDVSNLTMVDLSYVYGRS